MKIVFICGSIEPGRDGVGDYTRRLAGELVKQGNQVAVLALNDSYITEILKDTENEASPIFRIPAHLPEKKRFAQAKEWIDGLSPEWVSLQFVPYAFQPKGLPFSFTQWFKAITKDRAVHLMFHEGWVGTEDKFNFKKTIYSFLQRILVKRLIINVRPKVIHTHLPFYSDRLKELNLEVKSLPLFSNIMDADFASNENSIFRVGFFSQVEITAPIVDFLLRLEEQASQLNLQFKILIIGGHKEHIEHTVEAFKNIEVFKNRIASTGYMDQKGISRALKSCSLGITSVPLHALGKSGSVAAFIEHGLPVAAPHIHRGFSVEEVGFFSPNLSSSILLDPDIENVKKIQKCVMEAKEEIGISTIVKRFLVDIEHS